MTKLARLIILTILVAAFISPTIGGSTVQAASATVKVKLFFVILNGGGKIGCNDSIVPVTVETPRTISPLRDALTKLFSIKQETISAEDGSATDLTNTLHSSTHKVGGISLNNGMLKVTLTGKLSLAGECDDPRSMAQIEETASQYATINSLPVKSVKVFLNGRPLDSFFGAGDKSSSSDHGVG